MNITRNAIYDYVEKRVNTAERPVYCASRYEPVPNSFPACFITEATHRPDRASITLDFADDQVIRDFEVQVSSNKVTTGLQEAYEIMEDVETAMKELYFIETYCNQVTNIDPSVVRLVARFTRVIGGADAMPNNTN